MKFSMSFKIQNIMLLICFHIVYKTQGNINFRITHILFREITNSNRESNWIYFNLHGESKFSVLTNVNHFEWRESYSMGNVSAMTSVYLSQWYPPKSESIIFIGQLLVYCFKPTPNLDFKNDNISLPVRPTGSFEEHNSFGEFCSGLSWQDKDLQNTR